MKILQQTVKDYFSVVIVVIGLTAIVCGCVSVPTTENKTAWKASAERQEQIVDVEFTSHQTHLSAKQKQQLRTAKDTLNNTTPYHGEIEVMPMMATDSKRLGSIHQYLSSLGILTHNIKILKTLTESDNPHMIRIHFVQYQAMAPRCPGWTEPMTSDIRRYNVGPEGELHFNCTTESNLAKMVSDPKDLISPDDLSYGDGAYLAKTITDLRSGKVGQGDKTSSDTAGLSNAASALATPSATNK